MQALLWQTAGRLPSGSPQRASVFLRQLSAKPRGTRKRQPAARKRKAAATNSRIPVGGSGAATHTIQESSAAALAATGASPRTSRTNGAAFRHIWERYLSPVRFMPSPGGQPGTRARRPFAGKDYTALAQRLPLALALFGVFYWEETSPLATVRLAGPSMLPTMAADQSEIWAILPSQSIWRRHLFSPRYRIGDLVGFAVTSADKGGSATRVSCKRIIGLPGDKVRRYGAFVHFAVPQDPVAWGILWPAHTESTDWERESRHAANRDPHDCLTVPDGHVWVEADCPGLGLDSRQLGPIPLSSIRGRVVARLWPLWRSQQEDALYPSHLRQRPHPIALDEETLQRYNVHRMPVPARSDEINARVK